MKPEQLRTMSFTPEQIIVIGNRITAKCTSIEVRPWDPSLKASRSLEVSQFQRQRLIETVRVGPSGTVRVLS